MRWVIPVSDLSKLVKELQSDKMDYVEFILLDGTPIPSSDPEPACIAFNGLRKSEPEFTAEYDEIEVVSDFDDFDPFGGSDL